MIETIYSVRNLRKWVEREDTFATSTRMVYAHTLDELKDAELQKGMFSSIKFEEFLVRYMASKMKGIEYTYIEEDEEISYPAMILAKRLFHNEIKENLDVINILNAIENELQNEERYIQLMNKARQVFDVTKEDEYLMLKRIEEQAKISWLHPLVNEKDYEKTVRFVEDSIKYDKYEILNILLNLGRENMSDEKIQKIMKIKDKVE